MMIQSFGINFSLENYLLVRWNSKFLGFVGIIKLGPRDQHRGASLQPGFLNSYARHAPQNDSH